MAVASSEVDFAHYPLTYERLTSVPLIRAPGFSTPVNYFSGSRIENPSAIDFEDPFKPGTRLAYKRFDGVRRYGWLITSMGPDGDTDIPVADYRTWDSNWTAGAIARTYDPTNGTVSDGDLWISRELLEFQHVHDTDSTITLLQYLDAR